MEHKQKRSKTVRLTALDYVVRLAMEGADFNDAFCMVTGWIKMDAEYNPGAAYPVEEVAEPLRRLFEMRRGANDETPAAGTAGESRNLL